MGNFEFVVNQGYSLDSYIGNYNVDNKMGPAEREEEQRANDIEFRADRKFKSEKKRRNHGEEDSW